MEQSRQTSPAGFRVGAIGDPAILSATAAPALLDRLLALLPPGGAAAAEPRLLCPASATALAQAAEQAGWTVCRIAGLPQPGLPQGMLVLDGDDAAPGAADAAAAAIVLRNCEVVLAFGDARLDPLAELVRQAATRGVPVLWLAPGQPARLVRDTGWRVARDALPEGDAAWEALRTSLAAILAAPSSTPPAIERLVHGPALPGRAVWRAHRAVMSLLWRSPPAADHSAPISKEWLGLYTAADALAAGYADRYRSSYTLVLGLAAVALIAGVSGLVLPADPLWTAIPEAACLAGIIVLVRANTRLEWRSRLIVFRLLSELCRKQAALTLLGRSLPTSRIAQMTEGDELGWVGWRFASAVRAAPLPQGVLAGASLAAARDAAAAVLLHGQRAYHEARAEGGRRREARLVKLGGWAFGLTVLCVLAKLVLLGAGSDHAESFGLVAALLPALAAALFGFRAYAELELLVQQSERMIRVVDDAARSLAGTDTDRPFASQHIGDILEATAITMLADIEGWIQISRVKAVEPG